MVADFVDGDDVVVPEVGGRARLAEESLQQFLVEELFAKDLDSDRTIEVGIARKVDRTHAATAEQADYLVLAESAQAPSSRSLAGWPGPAELDPDPASIAVVAIRSGYRDVPSSRRSRTVDSPTWDSNAFKDAALQALQKSAC